MKKYKNGIHIVQFSIILFSHEKLPKFDKHFIILMSAGTVPRMEYDVMIRI